MHNITQQRIEQGSSSQRIGSYINTNTFVFKALLNLLNCKHQITDILQHHQANVNKKTKIKSNCLLHCINVILALFL